MTFADLAVGDRFIALATGVAYIKRTLGGVAPGIAERIHQRGDPPVDEDADGPVVFETMLRSDTPVNRVP